MARRSCAYFWRSLAISPVLLAFVALSAADVASAATHVGPLTYSSNTTWTLSGSPYLVDGDVTVAAGANLSVAPGVVVKLNGTSRTLRINGSLTAIGSAGAPVTFTSLQDDAAGGDSGGDGPTEGTPGQWAQIRLGTNASAEFRHAVVMFGASGSIAWNYGAITLAGTGASVVIEDSDISSNLRSGLLVGSGGVATVRRTRLSLNENGVSVNMGSVVLEDRTIVTANSADGIWFNLTSAFAGPASTLFDSDVAGNGRYGIYSGVDTSLPLMKWPSGSRNNIYSSGVKELYLGGYHPTSTPVYNVNWADNFWGDGTQLWTAPTTCASGAPSGSAGHLTFDGSADPLSTGPVPSSTYYVGTTPCAYDRFPVGTSFRAGYTPGEPTLTSAEAADAVAIAENDSRLVTLLGGRAHTTVATGAWARIQSDEKLGAEVRVTWATPTDLTFDWPLIDYDESDATGTPYEEGTSRFLAERVTTLEVLVDLMSDRVVAIAPGDEAVIDPASGATPPPEGESGRPTSKLRVRCIDGDCFWNYDFNPRARGLGPSSRRVDWPIGLIFHGNASIDKVKEGLRYLNYRHTLGASEQIALLNDGAGWVWDFDEGVKTVRCPTFGQAYHTRLYADADDQLYNLSLGFYVIASAHIDANECNQWGKWHGRSEVVEDDIARRIDGLNDPSNVLEGWAVDEDAIHLYNLEVGPNRGRYRLFNSGFATKIRVP